MEQIGLRSVFLQTYMVWGAFSFLNLGLFFPVLIPVLLPLLIIFCIKFLAFLLPVFVLAFLISAFVLSRLYKNPNFDAREYSPAIFNIIFIVVFLLVGEFTKFALIEMELSKIKPDCSSVNSFIESIINQGSGNKPEHAYYVKEDQIYFWSYSELKFVEGYKGAFKQYERESWHSCR
jgi:hypothetical protein